MLFTGTSEGQDVQGILMRGFDGEVRAWKRTWGSTGVIWGLGSAPGASYPTWSALGLLPASFPPCQQPGTHLPSLLGAERCIPWALLDNTLPRYFNIREEALPQVLPGRTCCPPAPRWQWGCRHRPSHPIFSKMLISVVDPTAIFNTDALLRFK